MEAADPRVHPSLLPKGSVATVYAETQPEYTPLPTVRTPGGTVLTRWTLTDAERAAIVRGEDIYVMVRTFNAPLQPLLVSVGPIDLSSVP